MSAIPYSETPRPDTGFTNGKMGLWLFLASEVMLFGALFSAYILLKIGAGSWPKHEMGLPLGGITTLLLALSSFAIIRAQGALRPGGLTRFRLEMGLAILLAVAFLCLIAYEYGRRFGMGELPGKSNFLGIYFTLTGLHALHVIGGLVVNMWLWGPGSRLWLTAPQRFMNQVEGAGIYWNFTTAVWFCLFVMIHFL